MLHVPDEKLLLQTFLQHHKKNTMWSPMLWWARRRGIAGLVAAVAEVGMVEAVDIDGEGSAGRHCQRHDRVVHGTNLSTMRGLENNSTQITLVLEVVRRVNRHCMTLSSRKCAATETWLWTPKFSWTGTVSVQFLYVPFSSRYDK